MTFSTKAEYGVRLMIALGQQEEHGRPTALSAVAEAETLPLAYLEHVVASLKKAKLVTSTRGAHGGYRIARPAEEIPMDEVVLALEGSLSPMECFSPDGTRRVLCSHDHESDPGDGTCATKLLWTRVQGGILRALRETTLADLVAHAKRREPIAAAVQLAGVAPDTASAAAEARSAA